MTDLSNKLIELGIDPKEYQELTNEEKEVVNEVIQELATTKNSSPIYEDLYYKDYDEIPVDFDTFLTSDEYIGKATRNGQFLYPFWRKEANIILNRRDINEVALSGCLSGDTVIPLIDGRRVTIKELAENNERKFKVYSYDLETNKFVVGTAVKVFSTGYKNTYTVTFDNGQSIRITGNHKFLLSNHQYLSIDEGVQKGSTIQSYNSENERIITDIVFNNDLEEVYDIEVERHHNFALEAGIVVHNSIGIGKSTAATIMMAYHLYKTMCLKDPQGFFGLSPGSKIVYALINNTLASSRGVGFDNLQKYLIDSPWFLKHGKKIGREYETYLPEKGFEFLVGSRVQHTLGRHIICVTGDTEIITSNG